MKNAPNRVRTCDIEVNSLTLYLLSYRSSGLTYRNRTGDRRNYSPSLYQLS
jgi:hypothetical protein